MKHLITTLLIVLIVGCKPDKGCVEGNCVDGYGRFEWKNGASYEGYWKDGQKHGKGKAIYRTGDSYIGDHVEDKRHGYGVHYWVNGTIYKGGWKNDLKHGRCKLIYQSLSVYEGEFENNRQTGEGLMTFGEKSKWFGDWYKGSFRNGDRHGYGIYYDDKKKSTYHGYWQTQYRHGQGYEIGVDSVKLEGKWEFDKLVKRNNYTQHQP
jgi:hypothetical protein